MCMVVLAWIARSIYMYLVIEVVVVTRIMTRIIRLCVLFAIIIMSFAGHFRQEKVACHVD